MKIRLSNLFFCSLCILYSCKSEFKEITKAEYNEEESITIDGIFKANINNKIMIIGEKKWYDITHNGSKYVVVGDGGLVSSSTDGTNWREPQKIGTAYYYKSIAYGNGIFVMGGYGGYVSTSTDGITWSTPTVIKQSMSISSVIYAQNKFIAVGGGYAFYSTNGINWTECIYTANVCFNHVVFGNGKFVTIGTDSRTLKGYVSTSTDGITWGTASNFTDNITWFNIGFGNGKFVAVGDKGYIMTSTDGGISWSNLKQITTAINWLDIIYSNGKFIVVGSDGYTSTSTDGVNWETPIQIKDESGNLVTSPLYGICETF